MNSVLCWRSSATSSSSLRSALGFRAAWQAPADYILGRPLAGHRPRRFLGLCYLFRRRGHRGPPAAPVYEQGAGPAPSSIPSATPSAIAIVGRRSPEQLWSRGLTTFARSVPQRYSPGVERLVVIVLLPGSVHLGGRPDPRRSGRCWTPTPGMGLKTAIVLAAVLGGGSTPWSAVCWAMLSPTSFRALRSSPRRIGRPRHHRGRTASVVSQPALAQVEPHTARADRRRRRASSARWRRSRHPDLRHHRRRRADLALSSAQIGRQGATASRLPAWSISRIGMVPVFLGLIGSQFMPNSPDPEQIVAKLAESAPSGCLLYIAFVGAMISAILSVGHSALHAAGGARSRTTSWNAWCQALTEHSQALAPVRLDCPGAQHCGLFRLVHLGGHPVNSWRRHPPSAAPVFSLPYAVCSVHEVRPDRSARIHPWLPGCTVWAGGKYWFGICHALTPRVPAALAGDRLVADAGGSLAQTAAREA